VGKLEKEVAIANEKETAWRIRSESRWKTPKQMTAFDGGGLVGPVYDEIRHKAEIIVAKKALDKFTKQKRATEKLLAGKESGSKAALKKGSPQMAEDAKKIAVARAKKKSLRAAAKDARATCAKTIRTQKAGRNKKIRVLKATLKKQRGRYKVKKKIYKGLAKLESDKETEHLTYTTKMSERKNKIERKLDDARFGSNKVKDELSGTIRNSMKEEATARDFKAQNYKAESMVTAFLGWEQRHRVRKEKVKLEDTESHTKAVKAQLGAATVMRRDAAGHLNAATAASALYDSRLSSEQRDALLTQKQQAEKLLQAKAKLAQYSGMNSEQLRVTLRKEAAVVKRQSARTERAKAKLQTQKNRVYKTNGKISKLDSDSKEAMASSNTQGSKLQKRLEEAMGAATASKKKASELKAKSKKAGALNPAAEKEAKMNARKSMSQAMSAASTLDAQVAAEDAKEVEKEMAVKAADRAVRQTAAATKPMLKEAEKQAASASGKVSSLETDLAKDKKRRDADTAASELAVARAKNKLDGKKGEIKSLKTENKATRKEEKKEIKQKEAATSNVAAQVKSREAKAKALAKKAEDEARKAAVRLMSAQTAAKKVSMQRQQAAAIEGQIVQLSAEKEKLWAAAKADIAAMQAQLSGQASKNFLLTQKLKLRRAKARAAAQALEDRLGKLRAKKAKIGAFFAAIESKNVRSAKAGEADDIRKQQAALEARRSAKDAHLTVTHAQAWLLKNKQKAKELQDQMAEDAAVRKANKGMDHRKVKSQEDREADVARAKDSQGLDRLLSKQQEAIKKTKTDIAQQQRAQTARIYSVERQLSHPKGTRAMAEAGQSGKIEHKEAQRLMNKANVIATRLNGQAKGYEGKRAHLVSAVRQATAAIGKVATAHRQLSQQVEAVVSGDHP